MVVEMGGDDEVEKQGTWCLQLWRQEMRRKGKMEKNEDRWVRDVEPKFQSPKSPT